MRLAFIEMVKGQKDTLPAGADVLIAVTTHGMPWDRFQWEAWLKFAPPYRDKMIEEIKELLKSYRLLEGTRLLPVRMNLQIQYGIQRKSIFQPTGSFVTVRDGYDYVISLPIEYCAENSDTLFQHAQETFHGFDGYRVYDTVDYPDFSVPYVRRLSRGKPA